MRERAASERVPTLANTASTGRARYGEEKNERDFCLPAAVFG
jgi:hypothetical protein